MVNSRTSWVAYPNYTGTEAPALWTPPDFTLYTPFIWLFESFILN